VADEKTREFMKGMKRKESEHKFMLHSQQIMTGDGDEPA